MIPKRWINSQNRKKSTLLKRLSKLKNVKKRWGEKAMLETMPISEKLKMLRQTRAYAGRIGGTNGAFTFGVE
ncbi:MAG: hypothetical protein ACLTBF_06825 [Christensenellales bacterium]